MSKCCPTYESGHDRVSSRRAQEYDRIRYVAFSRRIADSQSGEEAVADDVSAVWRMVRRRSMPTVWSTPDERGDWLPTVRGNARPGGLAKVAAGRRVYDGTLSPNEKNSVLGLTLAICRTVGTASGGQSLGHRCAPRQLENRALGPDQQRPAADAALLLQT